MQLETPIKSRSLLGVTDLTLLAPVKQGLIPALDARSYLSRLKLLFRTLGTLRSSSLEVEPTPLIGDAVERIQAIHSFRLAIVGQAPRSQVLLSVAFDGGWEPYMRRIWGDLGPLLDVIFCNCEGYLLASEHGFADYMGWVRSAQVETEFFYNASGLTVADVAYVRESARLRIDGQRRCPVQTTGPGSSSQGSQRTAVQEALPALVALYRLCDMYPPAEAIGAVPAEHDDGACLQRAAVYLLSKGEKDIVLSRKLKRVRGWSAVPPRAAPPSVEDAAVEWFRSALARRLRRARHASRSGSRASRARASAHAPDPAHVQGGILAQDPEITQGALVLISLSGAAAASALLDWVRPRIGSAASHGTGGSTVVDTLLAFTPQGLRTAGVAPGTLAEMPHEFLEGMAARASILGDVRENHPTHWTLPPRNWPPGGAYGGNSDGVELASVHAVVQFTSRSEAGLPWCDWLQHRDPPHVLLTTVQALHDEAGPDGVTILSVQPMQRFLEAGDTFSREHFGFRDGFSQPTLDTATPAATVYRDQVEPGDLLLGYRNSRGDRPLTGRLWTDSTFLVIRKLRQYVDRFEQALPATGAARRDAVMALIGRDEAGVPVGQANVSGNDFDYTQVDGQPPNPHAACPLHSHVRRANPRLRNERDGSMGPRILRRGMSYGPRYIPRSASAKDPRGLVFMSYQASIAEQFEVIQSWLSGGNSGGPGTYSAHRDPLLGLRDAEDPRTVAHGGRGRVVLPDKPLVTLDWGLYLFVPSRPALDELQALADEEAAIEAAEAGDTEAPSGAETTRNTRRTLQRAMEAQKGAAVIAQLRQAEQALGVDAARTRWKITLEDVSARMSGTSRAVWTAVRELNGGVLRTPYGVLVCSPQRVKEVFDDRDALYSVSGYEERMRRSFGAIYLGLDAHTCEYRRQSAVPNRAVMAITRADAFAAALTCTELIVQRLAPMGSEATLEVREIVDGVLAALSAHYFGIPDGKHVLPGGFSWNWRTGRAPTCPGQFHSPSRHLFQPHPGAEAAAAGQSHGQALQAAVAKLVDEHVKQRRSFGRIAAPMAEAFDADLRALALGPQSGDQAAIDARAGQFTSTLIGVMMGFLPTVDGNLRGLLYEWVNDRSLWDHQTAFLAAVAGSAGSPPKDAHDAATQSLLPPLKRTLKLRPVPEVVWRTAVKPHALGAVDVKPGDTIVVSIVSATQASLLGDDPVVPEKGRQPPATAAWAHEDADLWALFGGFRDSAIPPHPTHACPGFEMAMGTMLGVLAGLCRHAAMRTTLSPMSLRLRRRP